MKNQSQQNICESFFSPFRVLCFVTVSFFRLFFGGDGIVFSGPELAREFLFNSQQRRWTCSVHAGEKHPWADSADVAGGGGGKRAGTEKFQDQLAQGVKMSRAQEDVAPLLRNVVMARLRLQHAAELGVAGNRPADVLRVHWRNYLRVHGTRLASDPPCNSISLCCFVSCASHGLSRAGRDARETGSTAGRMWGGGDMHAYVQRGRRRGLRDGGSSDSLV